jgi:hypothetical protein
MHDVPNHFLTKTIRQGQIVQIALVTDTKANGSLKRKLMAA